ncbi:MAG TPA: DUF4062 domain-containing protein [Chthoniobacterales bacterium]|nr:DUF4062 domain-containing protein [Chthoniobacterales bacterium]
MKDQLISSRTNDSVRAVRLFISSTFRDMHAEREELVKFTLPRIRKLCEERGVGFAEIDLRWGITQEQSERGEVLPICFAEIDRCRPYFIGLLGDRYGWIPDHLPEDLLADQPWLQEERGKSYTELEIAFAIWRHPDSARRAVFYFRDPTYVERCTPQVRNNLREDDSDARDKVAGLKEAIKQSGSDWRIYPDPKSLGQMVLEDLTNAIDEDFPPENVPTALESEVLAHEAFARSRALSYIGREKYFAQLDEYVAKPFSELGLVVVGESGGGKTALLANWISHHRRNFPDDIVLAHYVGATADSVDSVAMLRRFVSELAGPLGIDTEENNEPQKLRAAFFDALHASAGRQRVVLVVDALNQLLDREGALELLWLPPVLPGNVYVVASTLQSPALDAVLQRGWSLLEVEPLTERERRTLIHNYLQQFGKGLLPRQVDQIASAQLAGNPLFLRVLLDELRVLGSRSRVGLRLQGYVTAASIREVYSRVLERLEEDYEGSRPRLVGDAMKLLWAARGGLSDHELLQMLGTDQPLPQLAWSSLYLSIERSLISRRGLLAFSHEYFREAVRHRYLPTKELQDHARDEIAGYFEKQALGKRKIEELPWQLAACGGWERLFDLLSDHEFFEAAWILAEYDLKSYWAQIETHTAHRVIEIYQPLADLTTERLATYRHLAQLLFDTGKAAEAGPLMARLTDHYHRCDDRHHLVLCLAFQAKLMLDEGDLASAARVCERCIQLSEEQSDWELAAESWSRFAIIHYLRGDSESARAMLADAARICRAHEQQRALLPVLALTSIIHREHGVLDAALEAIDEREQISRTFNRRDEIARSLGLKALILADAGETAEACRLLEEQAKLAGEIGDVVQVDAALQNQAVVKANAVDEETHNFHSEVPVVDVDFGRAHARQQGLAGEAFQAYRRGELGKSWSLFHEQDRICRRCGFQLGLAHALYGQSLLLTVQNSFAESLKLLRQQQAISEEAGNLKQCIESLLEQGAILFYQLHEFQEGQALMDKALAVATATGFTNLTRRVQAQKRTIDLALGGNTNVIADGNESFTVFKPGEEPKITRWDSDPELLAARLAEIPERVDSLGLYANERLATDDPRGARQALDEAERQCRRGGDEVRLHVVLGIKADTFLVVGDYALAAEIYLEAERICRKIGGDLKHLQRYLGNHARSCFHLGKFAEALQLHQEEEQICAQLDEPEALAICLGNQARIAQRLGDLPAARKLCAREEQLGFKGQAQEVLMEIAFTEATSRQKNGALEEALSLYGESEQISRALGKQAFLGTCLGNQTIILMQQEQFQRASRCCAQQEAIFRELGNAKNLSNALGMKAAICEKLDQIDDAMAAWKEQERLALQTGKVNFLLSSLEHQTTVFLKNSHWQKAAALCAETAELYRERNDGQRLKATLGFERDALMLQLQSDNSLSALDRLHVNQRLETLQRELDDSEGLFRAMSQVAKGLKEVGQLAAAIEKWRESQALSREMKNYDFLNRALGSEGLLLIELEEYDRALETFQEAERMCREQGMAEGLAAAISCQRVILNRLERQGQGESQPGRQEEMSEAEVAEAAKLFFDWLLRNLDRQANKDLQESLRVWIQSGGGRDAVFGTEASFLKVLDAAFRILQNRVFPSD